MTEKRAKTINVVRLKNLLESHLYDDLKSESYIKKTIPAVELLTFNRFDIAFKLLYLEMLKFDVEFSKHIYKEHIRAFSLGKFTEPGNDDKDSFDKFVNDFDKTFEDIKVNGFDSFKTLIPLSKNGSIANGAHRVASAIYLNKAVDCVQIGSGNHIYDYKFFYGRNVSSEVLDVVATKFVEYADNIHVAFLWPTAKGHDEEIENIIPNIAYRKEMLLTPNGAHNLLSQIYYGENWLGSVENDFRGAKDKLVECFKSFDPVRVVAFQANSLDEVLKIKDKIRALFNVGKHSVHITDTKEEAIRTARVVFNDNSVHFLNYARPNIHLSTHEKINSFNEFLLKNNVNTIDVALDSGTVLSAYGFRESSDIDYFVDDNIKISVRGENIELHDEVLKYHNEEKLELIYNPKNYFYFNDLKFISLKQLYRMKINRGEAKDIDDCKMMETLIDYKYFNKILNKIRQNIFYQKMKIERRIISFLVTFHIYNIVRNSYRFLKGKK
jgi:hypothetical protein